jgi:hypothetical protein
MGRSYSQEPSFIRTIPAEATLAEMRPGKRFEARLRVCGRTAPGLIQSANPPGKIGPVRTRDLQRFIGDVEGEDLFFFNPQCVHCSDPFRFVTTALFHEQLTRSLRVNYQHAIRKQTDAKRRADH